MKKMFKYLLMIICLLCITSCDLFHNKLPNINDENENNNENNIENTISLELNYQIDNKKETIELSYDDEVQLPTPKFKDLTFVGWYSQNGDGELVENNLYQYYKYNKYPLVAKYEFVKDDITYLINKSEIEVTKYTGDGSNINIIDESYGFPVTRIKSNIFSNLNSIGKFKFGKNLIHFESDIFVKPHGSSWDESYNIKTNEVLYDGNIEDWLKIRFYNEDSNPVFHGNIKFKNSNGFYERVESLNIPEGTERIGFTQFRNFDPKCVNMPDSVKYIEMYGLYSHSDSYETSVIKLSKNLKRVDRNAFGDNMNCPSLLFEGSREDFDKIDFPYKNLYDVRPEYENILKNVEFNSNVKKLNYVITSKYNYIEGNDIIYNLYCHNNKLNSIDFEKDFPNKKVYSIASNGFNCPSLKTLELPKSIKKIGNKAFYNTNLDYIHIPNNIEDFLYLINDNVKTFFNYDKIKYLKFDCSLEDYAKLGITNEYKLNYATKLFLKDNQYIEPETLDLSKNNYVKISELSGLKKLKTIYLPNKFEYCGREIFNKYVDVYYNGTLDDWISLDNKHIFNNCTLDVLDSTGKFYIPTSYKFKAGTKVIKKDALYGISNINEVYLPNGLNSIEDFAFGGSFGDKTIKIPDSVSFIGQYAFPRDIEEINIPTSLKYIGDYSYACGYSPLFKVPNTVKRLGIHVSTSSNLYLPLSIEEISEDSFYRDTNVYYEGSEEDFKKIKINKGYENGSIKNIFYNVKSIEEIKTINYSGLVINNKQLTINDVFKGKDFIDLSKDFDGYEVICISPFAFRGKGKIDIVIPNSIKKVGHEIFDNGTNIYLDFDSIPSSFSEQWLGYSDEDKSNKNVYLKNQWKFDMNGKPVPLN